MEEERISLTAHLKDDVVIVINIAMPCGFEKVRSAWNELNKLVVQFNKENDDVPFDKDILKGEKNV